MDSSGNIVSVRHNGKVLEHFKDGKWHIVSVRHNGKVLEHFKDGKWQTYSADARELVEVPENEAEKVKKMNRKQRRAWYAKKRREQRQK